MKFFLFFIVLPLITYAEDPHPHAPSGWVELNSISPVILTWAYADPAKGLMDVPSFMVQKFPRSKKFEKFVLEGKPDSSLCRHVPAKQISEWSQSWCLRKDSAMVLIWKGEESIISPHKKGLMKWILTHE